MIKGKTVLAVIPARGGSKGLPGKNIMMLAGKPLIAWTIITAKQSKYIDRLVLSSEDDRIIEVAKDWGCEVPFKRPVDLARDDTLGIEPALHALRLIPGFDFVLLLQPTSPLRIVDDIDNVIEACILADADACVSVTEASKNPFWMYYLSQGNKLKPVMGNKNLVDNRQQLPKAYLLNGAIYLAKTNWLIKSKSFLCEETIAYKMPRDRSIDIDDKLDFLMAEALIGLPNH